MGAHTRAEKSIIDYPGLLDELAQKGTSKIILVVFDGLGGLPQRLDGPTELEDAATPHLDALAHTSSCGLLLPVSWGITPGSGPGHFALFGYDPLEYNLGRGVVEAAGIGFELSEIDVAVRANFATVNDSGQLTDRRAGRPPNEENHRLCHKLQSGLKLGGIQHFVEPLSEHRFLIVFRGDGLEGQVTDTDPQQTGVHPLAPRALNTQSERTAAVAADFLDQAAHLLEDEPAANQVTLRGFGRHRKLPSLTDRFHLRALCLANYPMYRGVSRLIGMDLYRVVPTVEGQVDAMAESWDDYDFFFLHVKATDKAGEDGNFEAKVAAIEAVDPLFEKILQLDPDVVAVTGDHSTPATMRQHSWHPVPLLLHSHHCRADRATSFAETACVQGSLGQLPAKQLMALMLAHSGRLKKFGA